MHRSFHRSINTQKEIRLILREVNYESKFENVVPTVVVVVVVELTALPGLARSVSLNVSHVFLFEPFWLIFHHTFCSKP